HGKLVAPFAGQVEIIFHTNHPIPLNSHLRLQLLIHIPIHTLNLNPQHFTSHLQKRHTLNQPHLLIQFHHHTIQNPPYHTTTPLIITNSPHYLQILTQ
ncbi:PTS glucose transporter subunit IIA, partial [Bacillus altitudinis]|uniref:PTS glucose transporter subunit IIA n=1 Tax=Bacillus altitudinis TaxID=293387 RepID=UPI001643A720